MSGETNTAGPAAAMGAAHGRRSMLHAVVGWLALGPAALAAAWEVLRYLTPPRRGPSFRKVFVARRETLSPGDVHEMIDLRGRPLAILHREGAPPIAVSLVCTHLGCRVHWQAKEQNFLCPCHMGVFDAEGRVLSGPPPAPLARYELSLEGDNVFVRLPEV